ncbi:MAG: VanZ family protein [Gammaproteobacteria bacterium]|nr:VanZ family protein [Gammaproteobacteria bacterium]
MKFQYFRIASLLLTCCWIAAIYHLSSQSDINFEISFAAKDKLFHMAAYGLLGVFILGIMRPNPTGYSYNQVALATLMATVYGITDEWHQSYVPGRSADPLDLVADFLGALLATWAVRAFMRRRLAQQLRS